MVEFHFGLQWYAGRTYCKAYGAQAQAFFAGLLSSLTAVPSPFIMTSRLSPAALILSLSLLGVAFWISPAVNAALKVDVQGLKEDALRDNVLALLTVQRERETEGLGEGHVRRYFQRGPEEIRQALEPFGYYQVQIDSKLVRDKDDWRIQYRIGLGEPVRFTEIDVRLDGAGEQDTELRKALNKIDIKLGNPARHSRYEALRSNLQKLAVERGYLDATYTQRELQIDRPALSAKVVLHLATGPLYRFGTVSFGYSGLDDELLQRYVQFKPGDPYSSRRLLELQRALEDSNYFEKVDVQSQRDQAQDLVIPVVVTLESRKRHRYTAGLGFGTDTGARGLLGWEHRRINRFGHRMNTEIKVSEIRQSLTANYSLPLTDPRSDRLEFTAATLDEQSDTIDSRLYKLGVGRTLARGSWREALTLNYQVEDYRVGLTDESTKLLIPGLSYTKVRAENRIITKRGYSLQFDLRGAAQPLLSDTSFAQAGAKAKLIRSVGKNGRWIARAEGGTTWTADFEELPASLRYFAGGDQSVRGYSFEELGPRDASGKVIGGRNLIFGSLEYEHRVVGNWGVALFADTGNAFNNFSEGLETGVGIGLRWQSPIGMVRVDLASAVSQDNALRLHFTLGPDL